MQLDLRMFSLAHAHIYVCLTSCNCFINFRVCWKEPRIKLLSEPQYFDYYMIICIYIFMAYAKNIIVQSNFLVKNLLKSYNTLDI